MKTHICIALVACSFWISACGNKKDDNTYNPGAAVVKSITHSASSTTETFTYNSQGKVQAIQSSNGSRITYAYDSAAVIKTAYNEAGSIVTISQMQLDTNGLAIATLITNATGLVIAKQACTFNEGGFKTQELNYTPNDILNGKQEWVWGGDNLNNYAIYDSTLTNRLYDFYYWYYDPTVTSVGNANTGQPFLGGDAKLLVRQWVRHSYFYGDAVQNFEYTFDSEKRITEIKAYDYTGKLKNTDSYSYY